MNRGSISIEEKMVGHFDKSGETFDIEDVKEMRAQPPKNPHFPWIILKVAIVADVCDALDLDPTTIGALISTIVSLLAATVLFIWLLNKGGGRWKGKLLRSALRRFGAVILIEIVPVVGLVPAWTIFVILVFYKEKKIVKLFWEALDLIKGDLEAFEAKGIFSRGGRSRYQKTVRRGQRDPEYLKKAWRRKKSIDRIRSRSDSSNFSGVSYPKVA
jgi:hypothetical protein